MEFFYNCHTLNPVLRSFERFELTEKCKYAETLDRDYTVEEFQSVSEVDGVIRFPLIVRGEKDAYILLTSTNSFSPQASQYYEVGK